MTTRPIVKTNMFRGEGSLKENVQIEVQSSFDTHWVSIDWWGHTVTFYFESHEEQQEFLDAFKEAEWAAFVGA